MRCVKHIANEKLLYDKLEGWDEVGGRGHVYTYGRLMLIYDGNPYNIVEQLTSNGKKKKYLPHSQKKFLFAFDMVLVTTIILL